ncbi:polymorphic toxin type 44 domain-containing protein [Dyadobacter sp. CY343]|uniref:polymorphic toxin type 44 domain-containing protein n=1 Tax=Dyadobacter sp. CY343 TaxID=2907299 RepID=UPI001F3A58D0|nr:polymorphic toxin type 44 domain-containing protein [Dyadobacter sp. CY343]MCE7060689.1 polymorphic toxin type 44 domain-containing protein [Dyadobacter sp. CY343]
MRSARFNGVDPPIGYWIQIDPKPNQSLSSYIAITNNPVRFADPLGDTIIVDRMGYISRNDKNDNLVFAKGHKNNLEALGELGKSINISKIYKNLLENNTRVASEIYNPFRFRNLVKSKGEWDYKVNKNTIYGLGNDGQTRFLFKGKEMEAQDIGNHHFGAVANAYGFSQGFSLKQAGAAQIQSGTSKSEWQIYGSPQVTGWTPSGPTLSKPMLAPYGDDPRDQSFIKAGYRYYDENQTD